MSLNDPVTNMKHVMCINPIVVAAAATVDGASVDTKGFRWATFTVQIGVAGGATLTGIAATITSDPVTGGAFATAISGATFTAATLLAGAACLSGRIDCNKLDYSTSRWLRIEVTVAGAAVSVPISAVCVLSDSEDNTKYQTETYEFTV